MQNDFPADPRSDSQLDASSISMRRALAIADDDKCPDVYAALMRASKAPSTALFGLIVAVIPDDEMAERDPLAEAFVEFAPPRMTLSESGMRRLEAGHPRTRFTTLHELSHLWLNHRGKPRFRMAAKAQRIEVIPAHSSGERQADVHAAFALMPTELVGDYRDADSIARDFGVSKAAAQIRLSQIIELAPKSTPPDIKREIEKLKLMVGAGNARPAQPSVLPQDTQKKLAWTLAPELADHDPNDYRVVDNKYVVMRTRFGMGMVGGWTVEDGKIVPWESRNP